MRSINGSWMKYSQGIQVNKTVKQGYRSFMNLMAREVRMAHLASVASHTINGVAKLYTELPEGSVQEYCEQIWKIHPA